MPSTLVISVLHLLTAPVPALPSAPQDSAPKGVKPFQETKLNPGSFASITTAWLILKADRLPAGT